jgi:hypothetical protein
MPTYGKRMLLGLLSPILSLLPAVPGCAGARCSATVTLTLLTVSQMPEPPLSLCCGTAQTSTHQPNFAKSTYLELDKVFQTRLLTLNTWNDSWQSLCMQCYRLGVIFGRSSCAQNVVYRSGWAETGGCSQSEYPTIPNPGMLGRLGNPDQYALIDFYGHHRARGGERH